MTNQPDPRPLLRGAFAQAITVVGAVTPDQLGDPTPCTEFDVRALLGHLLAVADRVAALPSGRDVAALPSLTEVGDDVGAVAADFTGRADRAVAAWADDAVLERAMTVPWGQFPGFAVAGAYTMETVTHTWDLADATGRTALLDDDLSEATLAIAQRALPGDARDGFPFGEPLPAADGGDPHTRLAAWMGRRPVKDG